MNNQTIKEKLDTRIYELDKSLLELERQHIKGLEFDPNELLNCLLELRDLVKITRDEIVQQSLEASDE